MQGYAFQCRVTTEDPENRFTPDYGRITHYRSVGGHGHPDRRRPGDHRRDHHAVLRLAAGEDLRLRPAVHRRGPADGAGTPGVPGARASRPTSRSCSTCSTHPEFIAGDCTTRFIDETPELFRFPVRQNRAMRLLTYAAEITVNGFPGVARPEGHATAPEPEPPRFDPLVRAAARARASGSWRWEPTPSRAGCASRSRCS